MTQSLLSHHDSISRAEWTDGQTAENARARADQLISRAQFVRSVCYADDRAPSTTTDSATPARLISTVLSMVEPAPMRVSCVARYGVNPYNSTSSL